MKLHITAHAYQLALTKPLRVGDHQLTTRDGLLLELRDADGRCGFGDIAPLPGLHKETLHDIATIIAEVAPGAIDSDDLNSVRRAIGEPLAPSLAFGVESACINFRAAVQGCQPADVLGALPNGSGPRAEVPINGLIDGDVRDARRALEAGALNGYSTLKVKVGRRKPTEEREILAMLLNELPDGVRLRLDANRGLTLADSCALVDGIATDRIDYIEEPLADPTELPTLHARTNIAIALDESLVDGDESLLTSRGVTAWVLKPSLHGGLQKSLAIAARAEDAGITTVISSCFESGIGMWSLAQLAACAGPHSVPAGLGTDRWLADDTIDPAFSSAAGRVALVNATNTPTIARHEA